MKKSIMGLAVLLSGISLPGPGAGQAILNVEQLQSLQVDGLHGEVNGRLNLSRGNTDLFQVGGTLGAGFRATRHWIRIFLGMDRLQQNDSRLVENRYVHLRTNYFFKDGLRSFHFLQIQTNRNLLLRRRWLLGSGLRVRAIGGSKGNLEVGSGLMYESENLREALLDEGENPQTQVIRWSNLLVGSWTPAEGTRLVAVAYHQPDLRSLQDYRLLGELSLGVEISRALELRVSFDWRHDSRAPGTLESDDLSLKTGITFRTR